MDYKTKIQLEQTIKQQNRELIQDVLNDTEDLGPFQGAMVSMALNNAKETVLSNLLPICNSINSTPAEIKSWLDELFKHELKEYGVL